MSYEVHDVFDSDWLRRTWMLVCRGLSVRFHWTRVVYTDSDRVVLWLRVGCLSCDVGYNVPVGYVMYLG